MADAIVKLVCCITLLALIGAVSGSGYASAEKAGSSAPVNQMGAGSSHGFSGLTALTGESGSIHLLYKKCYFPIYNLPAYYVCIMVCKMGGGGDTCPPRCEAMLTVCD
jgi:hypothetical protein